MLFWRSNKKPATVLSISNHKFGAAMRARPDRGRCQHTEGHQASVGRALDGSHRAGKSKEHPTELSKHIAISTKEVWSTRNRYHHTDWHEIGEEIKAVYVPLDYD
eukprot:448873-Pyramimonas_sp.AAC.1